LISFEAAEALSLGGPHSDPCTLGIPYSPAVSLVGTDLQRGIWKRG